MFPLLLKHYKRQRKRVFKYYSHIWLGTRAGARDTATLA